MKNEICWYPTQQAMMDAQAEFYRMSGIPGILGIIDGTHIPIKGPRGADEIACVNRKGGHSINTQIVVGPNYEIRYCFKVYFLAAFKKIYMVTQFVAHDVKYFFLYQSVVSTACLERASIDSMFCLKPPLFRQFLTSSIDEKLVWHHCTNCARNGTAICMQICTGVDGP
jgi:hypothetical protein